MQELLKYQEIDAKLRKLNGELAQNENRKKAAQMQQYLKDTQTKLFELDGAAQGAIKALENIKKDINAVVEKLESVAVQGEDAESLAAKEEEVLKLAEKLSRLERDLNNAQNKLVSINKEFETLMKNAKTARGNFNFYRQELDKAKAEVEPKIKALVDELNAQKKKVNPEFLNKYLSKQEGKVFPIFVELKNNRCGGCRMEVPAGKLKDLNTKHILECENCGRIIYKL